MKQRSISEYIRSTPPQLNDYKVKPHEWIGSTNTLTSPVTTKKNRQCRTKKSKQNVSTGNTTTSPLHTWLQRKKNDPSDSSQRINKYNPLQIEAKNEKTQEMLRKRSFHKNDSFEKYGFAFPTADDILENIETLDKEAKMLDDYDNLADEIKISIPDSLKSLFSSRENTSSITLLTCAHLSQSQLDHYFSKHSEYLNDILKEIVISKRHHTYKNQNTRFKLTYSVSTIVFTQSQLEYLVKKIESELDPGGELTEYMFMVWLPELCLKIFMDLYNMSKEEAIDYLNERPLD